MGFGPHTAKNDGLSLAQILFARAGPHMGQLQATIARSGPHPVHFPLAMPTVGQKVRLDARSGPDPSVMWDVGPRNKTLQFKHVTVNFWSFIVTLWTWTAATITHFPVMMLCCLFS